MEPSPKYISQRPLTFRSRIAPALLHGVGTSAAFGSKVLKSGNSGPCFSQVNRSVEVARQSWALVPSYAV